VSAPRFFQRLPVFDSEADALDYAESIGATSTVLHPAQSEPVVGVCEVPAPSQDGEAVDRG